MPHPSFHPSFRRRALLVACMTVALSALLSGCTSSKDMKVDELPSPGGGTFESRSAIVLESATTLKEALPTPFDLSDQDRSILLSMADCLAAAGFGVPVGSDVVAAGADELVTSEALHRAKRARTIGRSGESGYELWPYSAGDTIPREAGESLYHALFSEGVEGFYQANNLYFKSTGDGWIWLAGADDPVGYTESLSNVMKTPRGIEFDLRVAREGAAGVTGVTHWHAVVGPCEDNVTGFTYESLVKTADEGRS